MKPVAIFLIILCVAALAGVGFLFATANLTVTGTGCVATDGADQAETFALLKNQVATDTFTGTPFRTEEMGEAGEYQFYTYTVRLRNDCFLKAEVVELQVTPMDGDVLQMGDGEEHSLRARSTGDISATILTEKGKHNVRELTVSWYFWGLPFTTRGTYSH